MEGKCERRGSSNGKPGSLKKQLCCVFVTDFCLLDSSTWLRHAAKIRHWFATRNERILYGWGHFQNKYVLWHFSKTKITKKLFFFLKPEYGSFNYFLMIISGVVLYTVVLETVGVAYILPMLECDLNLTSSEKGILSGATLFGIICSSHLWGYLADTKGRRAVIMPTLFVAFVVSVGSSFVQDFHTFTLLRFLNGFL